MRANRRAVVAFLGLGALVGACLDLDALQGAGDAQDGAARDLHSAADLGSASGCASGAGVRVGAGWACPGVYNANRGDAIPAASELCASSFTLCVSAAGLDLAVCTGLPGFFVAAVPLHRPRMSTAPADLQCGAPMGSDVLLLAGCGAGQPSEALYTPAMGCTGFTVAIDCSLSSSLSCGTAADLSTAAQFSQASGVLCCAR